LTPLSDAALAAQLATAAGRSLMAVRSELRDAEPGVRKAEGDRRSHEMLIAELAVHRPDDSVLSEEAVDDPARLEARRVWIIDPLDGTREFSELGRHDWAVHVALWEAGELTAGAVALPALGQTFSTEQPAALPPAGTRLRLVVSRTRPPALVTGVAAELDAELVPMGSAGAKAMAVLQGRADAYVHGGGQYEWDSAAPVAVVHAAGLHASRLDGSALEYNRPDPLLPDLLICRPELTTRLLGAIARSMDLA
jgi:3'(2'), 5'-bisphosphate nucleotidase